MIPRPLFLALALAATTAFAHAGEPWKLVWSDEFDGDHLDRAKWSYVVDCAGGGNDERQCYVDAPDIVSAKDGILRIRAVKRPTTGPARSGGGPVPTKTMDYASGRITTAGKASWRYGKVEARIRVPGGQGVWPAFWMMPETPAYGGWPRSGEIDILETINLGAPCPTCDGGKENRAFGTLHFAGDAEGHHRQSGHNTPIPTPAPAPLSPLDGFHVYGVEWSPDAIAWLIDGREYARATAEAWKRADLPGAAPFDQPFHIILNLAYGGRWPESANAKGVDDGALPATLEVDWVRVSQKP
jgi:beta-glucanase (GH16 family)